MIRAYEPMMLLTGEWIWETHVITCDCERPKNAASDALDWGDTDTITVLPEFMRAMKSPKLCFSSITVSADVIQPLR
jgi:hypothetical protein